MKTIQIEFEVGDRVRALFGAGRTGQVVGVDMRVSGNTYLVRWDEKPPKHSQLMSGINPDGLESTK